ncbi:MAG TPA: response regulator transcription factor [Planktothrix sp.]|jgi:DNA-binding NarL/FixJ family response regulator
MGNPVRVLLIQDKEVIRAGLFALLSKRPEITVCGQSASVSSALHLVRKAKPHVVIMDLKAMTVDQLEAPRGVREALATTRILMMIDNDESMVFASLAAEADGYCAREAPFDRVLKAILAVASGEFWLDSTIAKKVVKALLGTMAILASESDAADIDDDDEDISFSPRELEVLSLVSQGLSNQKIAEQLVISAETVKSHIRKIMKKLVVNDRTQAAVKALKRGLI